MKVTKTILASFLVVFVLGAGLGLLLGGHTEEMAEEEGDSGMWISPMHPHIRQNEPGQCPICGMDLVPMSQFKGMENDDPFLLTMSEDAAALARVETEQVVRGSATARLTLTGKIQANEQEIRRYAANYGARVEHLAVNFTGQQVRKGDLLAKLYAPELLSAQQELRQAAARKAQQPELYRAVREKLRLWKLSGEQIDALESGEELEDVLAIYADVSGIVTVRNVTEGDFITRGTVLFEIVDLSTVWAMLAVYEQDLSTVRVGTEVELELSGAPGKALKGKISYIDPVVHPQTRTAAARVVLANPGGRLKPEMFVRAVANASSTEGLVVPRAAVLWSGPRSVVFVQEGGASSPSYRMREVKLGKRLGDAYEILSGIEEGDRVVKQGAFAVDAAAQLTGKYSLMLRPENSAVEVDADFASAFDQVLARYMDLKDALVATDAATAAQKVPALRDQVEALDASGLEVAAAGWWKRQQDFLKRQLRQLAETRDVEEQRALFELVSDSMLAAVERFGSAEKVYVQYCPMAFDDKGASWLSLESKIQNPYFGSKMMTCGEVTREFLVR